MSSPVRPPIRASEHFTFAELCRSQYALRHGLDNTPPREAADDLTALCERVLEPIRELIGGPLQITSGYRSLELNRAIGGAEHSQHLLGQAADFTTWTSNSLVFDAIRRSDISEVPFDQVILEHGDLGWVHVSYHPNPRRQALRAFRDASGRTVYEALR